MRVLWVNEAADFVGGCEQYIFNTARLLRDHDVQSSLLYDCRHRFSTEFVKPFDQAFPMADIQAQAAAIRPDLIYIHRLDGRKTIEALMETGIPTVRFFHDTKLFCPREHRYTAIRHQTCHKPMGMRCYFPCLGFINRIDAFPGIRLNLVRTLRANIRANKRLHAFVVASRYMAALMVKHGFPSDRVHVIPLYALPPQDGVRTAREQDLFLFIGHLVRSKGVDTLLQAMALTRRPAKLVIAGQGRQEEMFLSLRNELGLHKRVTFVGRLSHDALSDWYRKAACVVLPVRQPESFALVGPEAMSYGTPVIATDIGGVETWLEDGKTGLAVPPNNPQALAQAMDNIVEANGLRDEMGENARTKYHELFRPEKHVHELLAHFNAILERTAQ